MKILVTGAAGFIGSHACERLLELDDTVVGLDNFNDYYDPERKRANLREIEGRGGDFRIVENDIRDRDAMTALIGAHRPDVVVHLAAMAGVRVSIEKPQLYIDVNLSGTLNLLDACREHEVKHFIFASTSSVYGDTQRIPFNEQDSCDRPLAPYPATKRAGEMLCHSYHHLYGLNVTVPRFFTVYGPRGRPDMMAYKVLDNIFFGREVPLYNNGQMYRDWTYVEDIVEGIALATRHPLGYQVMNLGRGEPILLADFVKYVEEFAGRTSALTPAPMVAADMSYSFADIAMAQELLGYSPKTSVREGVRKFCEWYQEAVLPAAQEA